MAGTPELRQAGAATGGASITQAGRDVNITVAGPRGPGLSSVAVPVGRLDHEVHGRAALLDDLSRAVVTGGQVVVLHAAGGYGKTTVAAAFAHREQDLARVWWVDATSGESLSEGLREVAVQAGAPHERAPSRPPGRRRRLPGGATRPVVAGHRRVGLREHGQLAVVDRAAAPLHRVAGPRGRRAGGDHSCIRQRAADFCDEMGMWREAERLYQEALDTQTLLLGPEHATTLTTRGNLALALRNRVALAAAEAECRKMLAIRERVLGIEHKSTLTTRNNLAAVHRERGDHAAAEAEYRVLLAILRRVLGDDHPDTVQAREHVEGIVREHFQAVHGA
ncbi:tetratricopeptide repeat protein [Saccharothrix deserti]|uniref:tetratricopeptide repeat protein n=1 Tax=Saccharothrix deserti TaxID=2593674 RepID=UPI00131D1FD0|nr:tetratricopeptide repeat protein [Saccharothrix deserti]